MNARIAAQPHEQHVVSFRAGFDAAEDAERSVGVRNDRLQFESREVLDCDPAEDGPHL